MIQVQNQYILDVKPFKPISLAPFFSMPAPMPGGLSPALIADLRSDHAGEVGAVAIYRGVLAISRDAGLRAFAQRHLLTEARHQRVIECWLPGPQRSRLLPGWRVAGWLTGALPAMLGPRAVYATVAAVEVFVDQHDADPLRRIDAAPAHALLPLLRRDLADCQADECQHRDEALARQGDRPVSAWLRGWTLLVGRGSAVAVALARRW